jgi:hypothetical protein
VVTWQLPGLLLLLLTVIMPAPAAAVTGEVGAPQEYVPFVDSTLDAEAACAREAPKNANTPTVRMASGVSNQAFRSRGNCIMIFSFAPCVGVFAARQSGAEASPPSASY